VAPVGFTILEERVDEAVACDDDVWELECDTETDDEGDCEVELDDFPVDGVEPDEKLECERLELDGSPEVEADERLAEPDDDPGYVGLNGELEGL